MPTDDGLYPNVKVVFGIESYILNITIIALCLQTSRMHCLQMTVTVFCDII